MDAEPGHETVALWSLWRDHRGDLVPFGTCCAMARQGLVPGAVPVACGTHRIRTDHISQALAAMRQEGQNADL